MSKWDNKFILLLDNKRKLELKGVENSDETITLKIKLEIDGLDEIYDKYEVRFDKNDSISLEAKVLHIMPAILKSINATESEISLAMKHLKYIIDDLTHNGINTKINRHF